MRPMHYYALSQPGLDSVAATGDEAASFMLVVLPLVSSSPGPLPVRSVDWNL